MLLTVRRLMVQRAREISVFDLVINLTRIGVDSACKTIGQTARDVQFRPVTYSIRAIPDHELACRVRARLMKDYPRNNFV